MARAFRILLVTRNFPPAQGGIETMALELARHAAANGVEMTVAHFGQTPCADLPAGLAGYHHLPGPGKWSTLLLSAFTIPWLVLRRRPDLVVNMQVTTGLGSRLAALLLRVPYAVIGLGLEVLPPRSWPPALSWRALALRGAKRVVSISRFTDGLVGRFGVPASRRQVVNLGTRPFTAVEAVRDREAAFGPMPEGTFVCLTLSRLVPRKGVDKALEALAQVVARRKDILYCIGGGGPDRARLESIVTSLNLGDHVRFLGRIPDGKLGMCYASADLFVLPSRTSDNPPDAEGFGIVFLEAGACGTPSLGGASGGIPDAIDDGVTGFLVDPLDPGAIAERMLRLMEDRELLKRMGEAARERARASTWERAAAGYFQAFRAAGPGDPGGFPVGTETRGGPVTKDQIKRIYEEAIRLHLREARNDSEKLQPITGSLKRTLAGSGFTRAEISESIRAHLDAPLEAGDRDFVEAALALLEIAWEPRNHTERLCKLLISRHHEEHEDIALELQRRKDPRAIPYLVQAARMKFDYLDYDEDNALARKCMWALGAIGTPEAWEAIRVFSGSEDANLVYWAREQLERKARG